jgi:hypothetical protein
MVLQMTLTRLWRYITFEGFCRIAEDDLIALLEGSEIVWQFSNVVALRRHCLIEDARAETQPRLDPALMILLAIISQYFTWLRHSQRRQR